MNLTEINALRALTYDELIDRLHREGGSYTDVVSTHDGGFVTKDSLRLAIIDTVVERELADNAEVEASRRSAPPPPTDPGRGTN